MRPRSSILEMFSTFLQFEADKYSGWGVDAKLRRSMQTSLAQLPEKHNSENFWAVYWHKLWRKEQEKRSSSPFAPAIALGHLSAYLQETCYWSLQKTMPQFGSTQCKLSDCFQIAIADVAKILKACDPDGQASLKSYSSVAFGNIVRNALRQQKEIDFSSDWGLLLKLSRKRLQDALQNQGLGTDTIECYLLAWACFEEAYISTKSPKIGKLQRPEPETWQTIAKLYNRDRQTKLNSSAEECSPQTLEKWLIYCATVARKYLYPTVSSLNVPKLGQESGELQDDLADITHDSLLADMIAQEEQQTEKMQQSQVNKVLSAALAQLDPEAAKLMHLYYQQGLTQQQIAQQQQIQQYKVSRRLAKARETLLVELTRWSQETLHISPSSTVVKHISIVLEEWLQSYYTPSNHRLPEESQ